MSIQNRVALVRRYRPASVIVATLFKEDLLRLLMPGSVVGARVGLKPNKRLGVTVVDLLVAVAGLSIVTAILLPAIQSAREGARMEGCAERLTGVALESHVYDAIHGQLPMFIGARAGVPFSDYGNLFHPDYWGWQQQASPLVLAASTSTEFDIDPDFFDYEITLEYRMTRFDRLPGWIELSKLQPARYRCPSNGRYASARPVAGHVLAAQPVTYNGDVDKYAELVDTSPAST